MQGRGMSSLLWRWTSTTRSVDPGSLEEVDVFNVTENNEHRKGVSLLGIFKNTIRAGRTGS